jgi:hypothetical protein
MESYAQAINMAAREAMFSGLVDHFRALAAELAEVHRNGQSVQPTTQWAVHGALAALESALFSKDELEARNITALVLLAFNREE